MGMQVNTNIAANNAYRNLATTQNDLSKSLEKLSSGLRINRAADDAAGLAISEGLKSQVGGLTVASRNAQDAISVIQTAEGSLNEVTSILQRVRDLAVQAGNDSNNAQSRAAITTEVKALTDELTRISESTNFNGTKLLDGAVDASVPGSLSFQVGADNTASSQIVVDLSKANVEAIADTLVGGTSGATGSAFAVDLDALVNGAQTFSSVKDGVTTTVETAALTVAGAASVDAYADALNGDADFSSAYTASVTKDANGMGTGIVVTAKDGGTVQTDVAPATAGVASGGTEGTVPAGVGLDFSSAAGAASAVKILDEQIALVSSARADLGANQNRFESVIKNLAVSKENLTAAGSRIRDTDMAEEMVKYTRANILSQAGTAMLAQANQSNQGVLQLLQ
ncbi:flagellin [Cryobacterium roopkundense]|uniref:Flagellin n=1 Tax=Cryobacterium roopkundense TaxID=1001240 RepID=A0A099JPX4_9MICO|nr:flagellin [Cryobacterium roopkundense]KGJ79503.1 flagellin [Cryobacterium roopkundense]MBB5640808.1 flagellin [Cryobacterium roopkundense]